MRLFEGLEERKISDLVRTSIGHIAVSTHVWTWSRLMTKIKLETRLSALPQCSEDHGLERECSPGERRRTSSVGGCRVEDRPLHKSTDTRANISVEETNGSTRRLSEQMIVTVYLHSTRRFDADMNRYKRVG